MTLTPGSRLGPYEIAEPIGAGGMGEVFRARDTQLNRSVAIKVLPGSFARDADRVARFRREAQVLASLNHPNIAAIHGLEESNGVVALVLELVEGEDLAARLKRGAVPVEAALAIARQIADGLEAAHDKGIVHRDLKPANIKLTPDAKVKLLDFGLAKAYQTDAAGGASDPSNSPTISRHATDAGIILGTAAYMSPEQARGAPLDKRSDIWSFGVVVFEMLTGRRAFVGPTTSDTLAAVLEREPDWAALPAATPASLRRLLLRCLEKDSKRRLRDIADVRFAIEDCATDLGHAAVPRAPAAVRGAFLPPLVATTLVVLGLGAGWCVGREGAASPAKPAPAADVTLAPLTTDPGYEGEPSFAPDGETVAYVSDRTGNFDIFLRQASGGRDVNLTDDAADDVQPAFSPDGKQIAFVSSRAGGSAVQYVGGDTPLLGGSIWVMPALGGSARRVADRGNFPSWSPDGTSILYTAGPWFGKKIYRVSAAGGAPEEVPVKLQPTQHWTYASYSPDGKWIAFEATPANIYVVPAVGGEPRRIARGHQPVWTASGRAVLYSSADPGRNFSLWQVPVSVADATVTGPARALTVGRGRDLPGSVSRDGKRVAFTARDETFNLEVMPFDVEAGRPLGQPLALTAGNQIVMFWSFSPDGRSLTFASARGAESHIWRLDRGGVPQALTSDIAFNDRGPRWSPDGRSIAFNRRSTSDLQANLELWLMAADGGNPRKMAQEGNYFSAWLPDGHRVIYQRQEQLERLDLATGQSLRLTNEPRVMPVVAVSPDGQWVVYQSTASGNIDLRLVSVDGGASRAVVATPYEDFHPFFSPSGRWLYFQPDHKNLARVPGPAQGWLPAAPQTVTHFRESGLLIEDAKTSPDGRELAFSRGRVTGDVWILDLHQR